MKVFLCLTILFLLVAVSNAAYFYTTALSFQSTLNQSLVVVLTTRKQLINAQGPATVAILVHGQTGSMNADLLPLLNNQLLDQIPQIDGVVRLDFTGHGASEGVWEYGNYAQEVSDLHACIQYLAGRGISTFATIGHSMGANIVLLHAHVWPAQSPRVVSMSSRYNMTRGIFTNVAGAQIYTADQLSLLNSQGWFMWYSTGRNTTFNITQSSLNERLAVDMSVVSTISSTIPVLLTQGTNDATIPPGDANDLKAKIAHAQLVFINGASHNYDPVGAELDVANTVALFLGGKNATTNANPTPCPTAAPCAACPTPQPTCPTSAAGTIGWSGIIVISFIAALML